MTRPITDDEKREVAALYKQLAAHHGWPLPKTWLGDRAAILGDIANALPCLRGLVAEQCPLPEAHAHWANTPESKARADIIRAEEARMAA